MFITTFYKGIETAASFALVGLFVKTQFNVKQHILKIATFLAGTSYVLYISKNQLSASPDFYTEGIMATATFLMGTAYDNIHNLMDMDPYND